MSLKVDISAQFNSDDAERRAAELEKRLNSLGRATASASKVKFDPISIKTQKDLEQIEKRMKSFLDIQREMARRAKLTDQGGAAPAFFDFSKMYSDPSIRNRKTREFVEFMGGGYGGGGKSSGGGWKQTGAKVVQAGLNAAGPAGGVASNAISTGMSSGFGAGMMGLLGGMAALGVSKAVGAIMDRVEQAEGNAVAYDRLKRSMGDVTVSFGALKAAIIGTADSNRMTYGETAGLAQTYARLGNLSGAGGLRSLPGELGMGIGMSRSFGLDPSQGVGVLGMMRGVGVTKSEQDTRRFAMLIGETIGKSGAFAKADEVMDALASYATNQTRYSLGGANVEGFGGMFSALVGSGIPGLDPAGAGSLLGRVNSALTAGGAKGEASQFFSAVVGKRMGLDPLQMQVLREGGAFATNDNSFGPGSIASRYGMSGPGGSTTFLQGTLGALRGAYGNNKGLLAQATANHLGINMRQAMAMLMINPNQMGGMEKYADLTKLSGSGISNVATALYGSENDVKSLANGMYGRTGDGALTADEKVQLDAVMKSGDLQKQREFLANMAATHGQESTQGSDIRDSKNALDNIKTALADKLIPLTQEMRAGIIYMAGGKDRLTSTQIMQSVIENDSAGRVSSINGKYDPQMQGLRARGTTLRGQIEQLSETRLNGSAMYLGKPELVAQKRAERQALERELAETDKKIAALSEEKASLLQEENQRRQAEIDAMKKAEEDRRQQEDLERQQNAEREKRLGETTGSVPNRYGASGGGGPIASNASFEDAARSEGLTPEMRKLAISIYSQESGGGKNTKTSHAGAMGHMQMLPATFKAFADEGWDINNPEHNLRAGMRYLKRLSKKSGGNMRTTAGAYYGGEGAINPDGSLKLYGDKKNPNFPTTHQYADQVVGRMGRIGDTPMPDDAALEARRENERARGMPLRVTADPLKVIHETPDGRPYKQSELLQTRVGGYMQQFRQG